MSTENLCMTFISSSNLKSETKRNLCKTKLLFKVSSISSQSGRTRLNFKERCSRLFIETTIHRSSTKKHVILN